MSSLTTELRRIPRRLGHEPMFTLSTLLILTVGIGATTAIFSVVNGVLLKPLPYPDPEQLVDVKLAAPGINIEDLSLSTKAYFIFCEQTKTFQNLGLYDPGINSTGYLVNITGLGEPKRVPALPVTANVLPLLGVRPLFGRLFTQADDSPGSAETAILTYGYWRDQFAGNRAVVGKTIDVDGQPR